MYISNYIFRSLEWWYSRGELGNPCVTENVIVTHCEVKKKDSFAFKNNPSIDLLIFISAFLKLLPFSKHFIQLSMCKINI